jgi:hypothetical protein
MEIGTPNDPSAIKLAFEIGGSLYVIKQRGIYQIKLADEIDPDRTNATIPNVQQPVLAYGADSEIVARTLLTAHQLFNASYLARSIDHKEALVLVFEVLKDLVAMDEIRLNLNAVEERENAAFSERQTHSGALLLPSVGNIEALCEAFVQKADHALASLLSIVKLFYGNDAGRKWFESLAELAEARYGQGSEFAQYMRHVLPLLQFVRHTRNCVEHPNPAQRIVVRDFVLLPRGEVASPTIEVIHPKTPYPSASVTTYMKDTMERIVDVSEGVIAYLCANNMRAESAGPFPISVVVLPPDQRPPYNNIRVCWGFYQGERVVVAS